MTRLSKLSDLSSFAQAFQQRNESRERFWKAFSQTSSNRPAANNVSDLLGTVMALSARTRRMVQPKVSIEMDVFAPGGNRALRIFMQDE